MSRTAKQKRKRELQKNLQFYLDYYTEVTVRGEQIKEAFDRAIDEIIEELKLRSCFEFLISFFWPFAGAFFTTLARHRGRYASLVWQKIHSAKA